MAKRKTKQKRKSTSGAKGSSGPNTGNITRAAIKAKQAAGASIEQIAKAAGRAPSTIKNIASGNIKNPPSGLASKIRGASGAKKKKKKTK